MIPTEYRLEHVVAGLAERIDSARRSFDDPHEARAAFCRMAEEHLQAASAEWLRLGFAEDAEAHAQFLDREVREVALPRLTKIAWEMNTRERAGYGLGRWATPRGRIGLVVAAAVLMMVLVRMSFLPLIGLWMCMALTLPIIPDVLRWLELRRYRRELMEVMEDMSRIQTQQLTYAAHASPDDDVARRRRLGGRQASRLK